MQFLYSLHFLNIAFRKSNYNVSQGLRHQKQL